MSNEVGNPNENTRNNKKFFNKKKWREQKYSSKAKVEKWDNVRRKQAQRQFSKELKKINGSFNSIKRNNELKTKEAHGSLREAQLKYKEMQRIKEEKRKEKERIEIEKNLAIKAYKEKKAIRFRKLSQKTSKGQPLMRTRMELLLEKIQKEYADGNS